MIKFGLQELKIVFQKRWQPSHDIEDEDSFYVILLWCDPVLCMFQKFEEKTRKNKLEASALHFYIEIMFKIFTK